MRRRDFLKGAVAATTGAATLSTVPVVSALTLDDFSRDVRCPCGCGERLARCSSPPARQAKSFIRQKIGEGWPRDHIIDAYVEEFTGPANSDYDLRVTVSKSGDGLFLWLFPPVSVVALSAVMYSLIRRRSGEAAVTTGPGRGLCGECGDEVPPWFDFCTTCGSEVNVGTCRGCGRALPGDVDFCTGCGEPVATNCPSCGNAVRTGAESCTECDDSL